MESAIPNYSSKEQQTNAFQPSSKQKQQRHASSYLTVPHRQKWDSKTGKGAQNHHTPDRTLFYGNT
jgi:hypothetical protein